MINQQPQQPSGQQPTQPLATQVQIRQNLALKQIESSSQHILSAANQPLSPTHSAMTTQQKQQVSDLKGNQGGRQKELKGAPQMVGLTSIEYNINEQSKIRIQEISQSEVQDNNLTSFYEEGTDDLPFSTPGEKFNPSLTFVNCTMDILLPYQMTLEHVELQLSQQGLELFKKYFKLFKMEGTLEEQSLLIQRSGFFEKNKGILEVVTCGVTKTLTISFLYAFKKKPSSKKLQELQELKKEQMFSKTQNVSEKIKNEILPLFNGSDEEDIDELDDEVAMISNKKSATSKNLKLKDMLSTEDIKIEMKDLKPKAQQPTQQCQKEEEDTRNFNTLPRNYSDPNKNQAPGQDSSYNDQEMSSNILDQQLMSKELMSHQESMQQQPDTKEDVMLLEQEIFTGCSSQLEEVTRLLQKCVSCVKVTGFNCNQIHAITNLTYFINQSFFLRQKQRLAEALEYDYLSGVLMVSTKRYTQAVEVFRKIQMHLLKRIECSDQIKKEDLFLKCATLELLISESMSQPSQLNDKLLSLERMCDLYQGKIVKPMTFTPQLNFTEDPFTIMIKIVPQLISFIVQSLSHKREIVRMSALKLLSFIFETQGCSLDKSMVFLLKALLKTYPGNTSSQQQQPNRHQSSFAERGFTQSVSDFFNLKEGQTSPEKNEEHSPYLKIKEPASGFVNAFKNAYNSTLDTYMSVLSSISSHILHQLFYEVILPTITNQNAASTDIKVFCAKMAEKVITICQGDLILYKTSLEFFTSQTTQKPQLGSSNSKELETLQSSIKNLWQSIRSKVFTNYSQKGLRTLIEWLVDKMSQIAQNSQNTLQQANQGAIVDVNANQDISKLEITEEESQQLMQLFDIVSMISVGRKNNEAEANSLIKIKQDYCLELYLLINPLLFWLDFSVEREERFPLFKAIYSTIKDVLENLPHKRVDIDLLQIMIPILQRTTEYLKNNSPSLPMLKFLDIVLRDLKQAGYCQTNPDLQYFFLDMLNNFVSYISYCLYEEVFSVFDKMMALCTDVVNEKVLTKCIIALVDKYTIKSKAHKVTLQTFMKSLMEVKVRTHGKEGNSQRSAFNTDQDFDDDDQISVHSKNNYFDILCDFCFFNNVDPLPSTQNTKPRDDFKSPIDLHDLYIDKLHFFVESLGLLTEIHVNLFTGLITHPQFKPTLMGLLKKGETSLRLKCHEILEVVSNYYVQHCTSKTVYKMGPSHQPPDSSKSTATAHKEVMEVEYINHERLYLSQLVCHVAVASLEQTEDAYLQFNSLIILDYLFQNLLPVPTYQNEMQKERINKSSASQHHGKLVNQVVDLQGLDINEETPEFEVTSPQYAYMRAELVLKLWPYVQTALNSPWSNIRSICYGLICSMLKVDLKCLMSDKNPVGPQYANKIKAIVLPMLESLLSSKESESKAGGLNILGSFCGLSYDFSKVKISQNLDFFRKNSSHVSVPIWQLVFDLQDDWDITIKEASVVLIQLCAPRDCVKYFDKVKRDNEDKRFTKMLQGYGLGHNLGTGGDQSSRLNSARDNLSLISQEDFMPPSSQSKAKKDLMSFLNNGTEDLRQALQQDQQQQPSGLDIFDHIGNTINTLPLKEDKKESDVFELNETQKLAIAGSEGEHFDFFVDAYADDQIQEIISIFRNDFKPPKNLWIEKNQNSGFSGPDYYADIFSSAIDQFNQQQLQLQQQQQQQQQLMVASPKNKQPMVDALEDDLVKKYENERKEKKDFMIFERHFEEDEQQPKDGAKQEDVKKDERLVKDKVQEQATCEAQSEQPLVQAQQAQKKASTAKSKEEKKKTQPQLQLQATDDNTLDPPKLEQLEEKKVSKKKKTTDELIEEYERKISKTKQLLEEEKKKNKQPSQSQQPLNLYETGERFISEAQTKSTPEFKQKPTNHHHQGKRDPEDQSKSAEKNVKKQQQPIVTTELPRSFQGNMDNAKLIKQINNCFNDNSFNNFNIGPVVMTASLGGTKHKQKLNKSFENILAANKQLKQAPDAKAPVKKNLSTSPRRGSSSGKKSGSLKSGTSKRKYLDQSYQNLTSKNQPKALYNMRDLNYFIKTIEKDLSDKFTKLSMKDFNSMPTTPTSILKKVEDQMKAMASQGHVLSKGDIKAQMSNTCPNIAQVLSQLDQPQAYHSQPKQAVLTQLNMNAQDLSSKHQSQGYNDPFHSSQHTPSNISNIGGNMLMAQSQNSLSNYSIGNQLDKFTFSKTQKIDLKDTNKNLFGYPQINGRDGQTARDHSNENSGKYTKAIQEVNKSSKVKAHSKGAHSKRSRGSQDKYLTANQALPSSFMNNQSSSSSQSKLNKSLNNISRVSAYNTKKKEQLSKSMINSLAKAGNLSPTSKKLIQQMIKQQLTGAPQSQAATHIQQTPATTQGQQMTNQYSYSTNMLYDYIQNSDQTQRKLAPNTKTPVKQGQKHSSKGMNYSEIIEISPSSGDKHEHRPLFRNIM